MVGINKLTSKNTVKAAVFRALQLGDMLCVIPAVRAFKMHYPDSDITLIGLPWARDFAIRFSRYFSSFIAFPGYPGLIEQPYDPVEFGRFVSLVNEKQFDLLIQMHGNGSVTNKVVGGLSAKIRAGYFEKVNKNKDEKLFMEYPDGIPEVERHLQLMEFLGVPVQSKELEFPITEEEWAGFEKLFDIKPGEYVCIHPGARDERRRWAPENFAHIADEIINAGLQVVLTGSASEVEVVGKVKSAMRHPTIDLSGKTELGVLAALIENSRLLVCNDTGVSHIAAAVGAPSVVIFLVSDPKRWAPFDRELHHVILPNEAVNIDRVFSDIKRKLLDESFDNKSLRVA